MKIPLNFVLKLAGNLYGALHDPARGALSLTRSAAVTLFGFALAGAGKSETTIDVVETGIYAAAGVAALAVRGRKDPPQ